VDKKNGRPTGARPTINSLSLPLPADNFTARAHAGPPVPGRRLWAVTVLSCPLCGAMHQHRAGMVARLLSGRLQRICPTTGRKYTLRPVQRRREARRG
jgi:hypothetical protein